DGAAELFFFAVTPDLNGVFRILESDGDGHFLRVFDGPSADPIAFGDIDQDGRADLVCQYGAALYVYESPDEHSYPSQLVWQSPPITTQVGECEIADTDMDGRLEIVYLSYPNNLVIFECEGDNSYVEKLRLQRDIASGGASETAQGIYSPWVGERLLWDLNENGRPEIAKGYFGELHIYESTADDTWEEIFADSTGLVNARVIAGGMDTDGNGKKEMFLGGEDPTTSERNVFIYEADGNRSFRRVATLAAYDGV